MQTADTTNLKFPGLPEYEGPTKGYFGLIDHDILFDYCDNMMAWVAVIKREKPPNEIASRLRHLIYLDPAQVPAIGKRELLDDDYIAKRKPLDDEYLAALKSLNDEYMVKRKPLDDEIESYILSHVPDCQWNGSSIFPSKS